MIHEDFWSPIDLTIFSVATLSRFVSFFWCSNFCFQFFFVRTEPPGDGVLPYMGYIGMCRCEGYGFQAVYSRIGYINQSAWV